VIAVERDDQLTTEIVVPQASVSVSDTGVVHVSWEAHTSIAKEAIFTESNNDRLVFEQLRVYCDLENGGTSSTKKADSGLEDIPSALVNLLRVMDGSRRIPPDREVREMPSDGVPSSGCREVYRHLGVPVGDRVIAPHDSPEEGLA